MRKEDTTIVICCAGMGTRLGIGTTKALLDINGRPLIIRQLELLQEFDDVRIVVGYQAESVIAAVTQYRKNVMFAFNYQYETTGVAQSLQKGIMYARENVIMLDGDVLINPGDFQRFISSNNECVCYSQSQSSGQVLVNLDDDHNVTGFSEFGNNRHAWAGVARIKKEHLSGEKQHAFELISQYLPIKGLEIRSFDIDTVDDYEAAIDWFNKGCC